MKDIQKLKKKNQKMICSFLIKYSAGKLVKNTDAPIKSNVLVKNLFYWLILIHRD